MSSPAAAVLEPESLPATPGAYLLVISLEVPRVLEVGALGRLSFPAGHYAYCGNAYGPGGLRARIARHLRLGARKHWHVDHLRAAGRVVAVRVVADLVECVLVERLRALPGTSVPVPGFGSSDCRRCPAHLLRLSPAGPIPLV